MPTGYTHPVQEGKITTLEQYIWTCARAFGALITMRDDPMNAPIPARLEPDGYHHKELTKATKELALLEKMTKAEIDAAAKASEDERLRWWEESRARTAVERERYQAMLDKVNAWMPPTKDHENFKVFMAKQLEDSIKFDCREMDPFERVSSDVWYAERVKSARHDIEYHRKEHAEELDRTAQRNAWLDALRNSDTLVPPHPKG